MSSDHNQRQMSSCQSKLNQKKMRICGNGGGKRTICFQEYALGMANGITSGGRDEKAECLHVAEEISMREMSLKPFCPITESGIVKTIS